MPRLSLPAIAAAGLSLALSGAAVHAQPTPGYYTAPAYAPPPPSGDYAAGPTNAGEVIVRAPYRRAERNPATGAPIERISVSRRVQYGDLDLASNRDVRVLHDRVALAARDACDTADRNYDVMDPGDDSCVARAIIDGMRQAPIARARDVAYVGQ
jgi:UrcA family protein